ncbi:MAG: hypothetical protein FD133_1030 [Erysipelotrichaceae bacterium]|nr:MAG: hypothetical protein FD179_79 [Erysipelotrichaceae bacterium]TXT18194.1 MAG: hypothetical protein FD133_1030 [Erysipelotrichaceae bacterium]
MIKHGLLLTLILMLLSSCVQGQSVTPVVFTKPEKGTFESPKGTVTEPDHEVTWIRNQLTFKLENSEVHPREETKIQTESYVIDGLKDEAVEAKINKAIADKVDSMIKYADFKNIPPSQGLYIKYPKDTTVIPFVSIRFDENFNYNNILSLSIYTTIGMDKNHENRIVISEDLTFDLNTGNIIHLSDLFINGFDYETVLNSLVLVDAVSKTEEALDSMFESYIYRGGFTGIRSDVGFSLSEYGGLTLTFNTSYKEFDNKFSYSYVTIPYSQLKDAWAFGQRFMSEESLFTNPKITRQNNYLYTFTIEKDDFVLNDIHFTTSSVIYDGIEGSWLNVIKTLKEEDTNRFKNTLKNDVDQVNYWFHANVVSQYMRISRRFESYKFDANGNWLSNIITEKIHMVTQDGKMLTLDDVFIDGYDYESTLKNLLSKYINEEYFMFEDGKIPTVDEAYNSLNFSLSYDWITFYNFSSTPPDQDYNEISFSIRIEDFKAFINPDVLLK